VTGPDVGIFFAHSGSGHADRTYALAEGLRARGFRVTLYNDRGLPGTYVPVRYSFPSALVRLLHTRHDAYLTSLSFVPSLCLALNRFVRGRPYVFIANGVKSAMYRDRSRGWTFPGLAERRVYPFLIDRVLAGAGRIVCNSRFLQSTLRTQFPRHAGKMITIYNGIDLQRFASGRPVPIPGVPPGTPVLVAVMSWNYEAKAAGARLLIDAMGRVVEKYPGARLVIAALARHRRHADAIEAYLTAQPWRHAVHIFSNYPSIPDLLASADVFLYATASGSNDSMPRAVLEAHAAGLPIVTTATAGCPEIVEDSVTGFLVPYEAKALADRAIQLLADPAMRREFGHRGQRRIRDLFNWERMVDGYADALRQLVYGTHLAPADHTGRPRRAAKQGMTT
jgi:glycosyltransferase involved in cell wall biosynthesis